MSKGRAVSLILKNGYDFCLCVGNDRSDEDMFEACNDDIGGRANYCVVVGQKPSKAAWYVNDVREVVGVMERMITEMMLMKRLGGRRRLFRGISGGDVRRVVRLHVLFRGISGMSARIVAGSGALAVLPGGGVVKRKFLRSTVYFSNINLSVRYRQVFKENRK